MIIEKEFEYTKDYDIILKEIYQNGLFEENDNNSNIIIKYYGNKSQIPLNDSQKNIGNQEEENENSNSLSPDDPRNDFLFIKYKDIYYGAALIKDIYKRENFGLNKYSENSFYIGRWKENMKEGIGFLKIDENLMYIGNFENNQFNGFGILYNKTNKDLLFGEFNHGECEEGIFYNDETEYLYRGKIKNGKKNDELCTFFDTKNGYLFIGETIDDEFHKGYVGFCRITDDNNNNAGNEGEYITFNVQKMFYFEGLGADNKTFIHYYSFTPEFYDKMQDIMYNVFQADYNLKDQNKNLIEYFTDLENIENNPNYHILDNYNSFINSEQCVENEFISNYYNHYQGFRTGQKDLFIRDYEDILKQPQTLSDNKE